MRAWARIRSLLVRSAVAIVPGIVVIAWALNNHKPEMAADGSYEYRVEVRTEESVIPERGIVSSRVSVPVKVRSEGQILSILPSGTHVRRGDVIVRTDEVTTREAIRDISYRLSKAEIDRRIQESKYRQVEFEERSNLAVDKARLDHAILEERVETRGLTAEDRRLLEIEIELAKLDLEDAADELGRQRRLLLKGFVTQSAVEPFERTVQSASAFLSELQVKYELKKRALPLERRVELRENVERARSAVERGEKAVARKLEEVQNSIEAEAAEIRSGTYSLAHHHSLLSESVVRALSDGVLVLRMFRDWRSSGSWTEYRPGVKLWGNDVVADIVDPASMQIDLIINEADFNRVKRGANARVQLPGIPGSVYKGVLTEIGGIGRDRFDLAPMGQETRKTGVTVFNAVVDFHGKGQDFRPGMSADVEIVVEEAAPRLLIPRSGVRESEGNHLVRRKSGSNVEEIFIQGRIFNEEWFLVEEGLREGDVIYIKSFKDKSA